MIIYRSEIKETLLVFTPDNLEKSVNDLKTKTRRVMRPQPSDEWRPYGGVGEIHGYNRAGELDPNIIKGYGLANADGGEAYVSPYGQTGDILLQAEPYQIDQFNPILGFVTGRYLRDDEPFRIESERVAELASKRKQPFASTPARFMPKELARTRYAITHVKAEMVQEISETDARGEGVEPVYLANGRGIYRGNFASLWDEINYKRGYGWNNNPWVWAYTYERILEDTNCTDCGGRWIFTKNTLMHIGQQDNRSCIPF